MFRLPQSIPYALLAVNLTAVALVLQLDILRSDFAQAKLVAWLIAGGVWWLAYARRKKYFTLF